MKVEKQVIHRPNIFDCVSLYSLGEMLKESMNLKQIVKVDYTKAKEISDRIIRKEKKYSVSDIDLAYVAINLHNEQQSRFVESLDKSGIDVIKTDYKHAYVSDHVMKGERTPATISPQVTYLLGLLAQRKNSQAVIWSPSFDLYAPLLDFTHGRGGQATVAYFRRYLDPRWTDAGLFDKDSPIDFFDLTPFAEAVMGIKLESIEDLSLRSPRGGLSRI